MGLSTSTVIIPSGLQLINSQIQQVDSRRELQVTRGNFILYDQHGQVLKFLPRRVLSIWRSDSAITFSFNLYLRMCGRRQLTQSGEGLLINPGIRVRLSLTEKSKLMGGNQMCSLSFLNFSCCLQKRTNVPSTGLKQILHSLD